MGSVIEIELEHLGEVQQFKCRAILSRDLKMGNLLPINGDRLKVGCGGSVPISRVWG